MCGRFVQALPAEKIVDFFGADPASVAEAVGRVNFNVAPSQQIINVLVDTDRRADHRSGLGSETTMGANSSHIGANDFVKGENVRTAQRIYWGMLFPWSKSEKEGPKPINARAESVAEKPAFRRAFLGQRSLVPADGFYEWKRGDSGKKTPYFVKLQGGEPLAIAAIWSDWEPPEGGPPVRSCALITVPAAYGLGEIHNRMPALIEPEDFEAWLDPEYSSVEGLMAMLGSKAAAKLEWYPVSARVNSPAVNDPDLVRPVNT